MSEPTVDRPLPFAERVRRRMAERGLGLRELCRAVALDPSFFSKVLAGKRSPPSEDAVLRRIARTLELDACELILAAGRIPREWDRLWSDRPLLEAVQRLFEAPSPVQPAGARQKPSVAAAAAQPRGAAAQPRGAAAGSKPFGDELL